MTHPIISAGHVALVTGAAMGIGKAAARHFAEAGMQVAMADLPGDALDAAAAEVGAQGDVLKLPTDVAEPAQLATMRERTLQRFGKVSLLMNNAVTRIGRGHDAPLGDWRKAFEVNFWAVVQGVRLFLPDMRASAAPGLIVNVGSKQGITNPPGHPIYNIAKSAVKTYTEGLQHELRSDPATAGRVSAHLLVPGWTTTGTAEHKPGAWLPHQVVELMAAALGRGDFYIVCPDDEVSPEMDRKRILWGAQDITENRPPLSRWHAEWAARAKDACS
jgi:NAD(P)-dependent dehydrogenase (short-subunit alcohol dehydrogenase family)